MLFKFVFTKTARYPGLEVEHNQFRRTLRTLAVNIKYRGLKRTLLGLLAALFAKTRFHILEEYRFFRQNMREIGLDIAGVVETDMLDIPEERKESAKRYEASSDYEFRYVVEKLHLDYEKYHFIDFGSGKGAVLASASRYPFKSVTGVELSQALHETATRNIAELYRRKRVTARALRSVHGDVTEHSLPPEPHVIYVFNAFGADILAEVIDHILRDLAAVREPIYFLYNNPMHHKLLEDNPAFEKPKKTFGGKWEVFVRPGRDD